MFLTLALGHFLFIRDGGIWTTLQDRLSGFSSITAGVLMVFSAVLFYRLMTVKAVRPANRMGFLIIGFLAAMSGLLMWFNPYFFSGFALILPFVHGFFVICLMAVVAWLVFKK
jgi:hypothetical protein